jgi:hypothetical protein
MGQGINALGTESGRTAFLGNAASKGVAATGVGGTSGLLKSGLAAIGPALLATPEVTRPTPDTVAHNFSFDYGRVEDPQAGYDGAYTGERTYFNPTFTRRAADGGMMDSGPIEEMSDRNQMETMMANGGQMFAAGGQVNLQGTFTAGDQGSGQFGQANANGYQAAGGAPLQGFSSSFGQMGGGKSNQIFSGGFGTPGGIDPRAVQADPQGFQRWMQGAQQQEQQVPGSTFLNSNTQGSFPGQLQALQQQMRSGGFGGYGQAMSRPSGPGGGMMSGMGGTAENGFMSPGGNGSTAGGLMEQLQQMQKDQANSTYGGGMGGSNATPLAHVLQPSENRLGSLGRKHPSEYTLEETLRAQQSRFAQGGMASMARGGPSHLGDYSDGGRLLKGPGDGVSDSIPATIANKRPARLADGEFVVPARIVSELGNGSTEAGARKLYDMMDRVQKARGKTTGKNRVAVNSRAEKLLPA